MEREREKRITEYVSYTRERDTYRYYCIITNTTYAIAIYFHVLW